MHKTPNPIHNRYATFCLAIGSLLAVPAWAAEGLIEEQRALNPEARLSITNVAGEIRVQGWDKPQMSLQALPGRAFEELRISGDADNMKIEVKVPKDARNVDGTDLQLSVPHAVRLFISAVSADVNTDALSGPLEIKTVSGDVVSQGRSPKLRIKTVSGDIELQAPSADTELGTVSGDIQAQGLLGEFRAESVSGSLQATLDQAREVRAKAVSGDLDLRLKGLDEADVRAESLSGDITVWLPADSDAQVEMSTFSGDLDSELGPGLRGDRKEHAFTLGKGGNRLQLSTFSGDAELRKP